jgi:hypothetical protein
MNVSLGPFRLDAEMDTLIRGEEPVSLEMKTAKTSARCRGAAEQRHVPRVSRAAERANEISLCGYPPKVSDRSIRAER